MQTSCDPIDTQEKLEEVLGRLQAELPPGVKFLGPLLGAPGRTVIDADGPREKTPNPVEIDVWGGETGWRPLIVSAELILPMQGTMARLYTVHFCVDDLLTADEVRGKVFGASLILMSTAVDLPRV